MRAQSATTAREQHLGRIVFANVLRVGGFHLPCPVTSLAWSHCMAYTLHGRNVSLGNPSVARRRANRSARPNRSLQPRRPPMAETPTFGRYAEIPYEQMTPEQQEGYRSLIETRGRLPGPNKIYVHRIGFFIFPVSEVLMTQGGKRRVRDTRGQADEGWTTRM